MKKHMHEKIRVKVANFDTRLLLMKAFLVLSALALLIKV